MVKIREDAFFYKAEITPYYEEWYPKSQFTREEVEKIAEKRRKQKITEEQQNHKAVL